MHAMRRGFLWESVRGGLLVDKVCMYVCLSVDVGIFVYMMKMQIQVISVISVVSYLVVWYGNWYILGGMVR